MKGDQRYSTLFEHPIIKSITEPIGRRRVVRNLLFGSSVAALTPMLGSPPGVSAATLGYQGIGQVRILELTGKALQKELARIEATPEFHAVVSLVRSRGFDPEKRLIEGLQIFTKHGQTWLEATSCTIRYLSSKQHATPLYYTGPGSQSVGVALPRGSSPGVREVYEAQGGALELVGLLEDQGSRLVVQQPGRPPLTVERAGPTSLRSFTSASASTATGVCPCLAICSEVVAAGCGVLGALVECSAICLGPEDVPCLAICAAAVAVICAYGNIDCGNFCSSYC